ncbi:MAG: ABC transporter ATP-binding protein [Candidatus Moranbacteria bacterium]|jgi:putative ABC transport system ATP-binding protein|nr:ABC transporter ATP-binding protein [Candidatus Moranbacteria bacterium]MDX9855411.1 ABC transporter ATP-binding protein [Candidatus Moranbacteria bacterium]
MEEITTKYEEVIIELQSVNFIYNKGKDNAYQALYDINLKIKKNDFLIIFGPSGCGKSSLLNVISGLEYPDEGEVFVLDKKRSEMTKKDQVQFHRKTIGMIFQAYNLIPTLNVLDNVAIPQIFINKRKKEREARAMELLDKFGIKEYAERIPTELSGGQQQRIGIARTLINDQPIILADEPVGNLDSKSATNVMHILNRLNTEENKTIIMVSHNPENIIWGNHIIYMKDGRIEKEEFRDIKGDITEVNKMKQQDITDIEALLRNFQGLTKEQIRMMIAPMKAKILARAAIFDLEEDQHKKLEDGIRQRILNTINPKEFFDILDRPEERGGVELNARTAHKISEKVEEIIKIARISGDREKFSDDERASIVSKYISNQDGVSIQPDKFNNLRVLIKNRLNSEINRKEFSELLDKDKEDGGAGLNKQTAKKIAKHIDLILMISYGMT